MDTAEMHEEWQNMLSQLSEEELAELLSMQQNAMGSGEYLTEDYDELPHQHQPINLHSSSRQAKAMTLKRLTKTCMRPILSDLYTTSLPLIFACLILLAAIWIIPVSKYRPRLLAIITILLGVSVLMNTFNNRNVELMYIFSYLLFLVAVERILAGRLRLSRKITIPLLAVVILALDIFTNAKLRHATRGIFMIMNMKILSVLLDSSDSNEEQQSFIDLMAYLLQPGTLIFGPFITFKTFQRSFNDSHHTKFNARYAVFLTLACAAMMFTMLISTCAPVWLTSTPIFIAAIHFCPTWLAAWMHAFIDAVSFRFSHYAVCYMSQFFLLLSSPSFLTNHDDDNDDGDDFVVTRPWRIEFPRSLVDVVVNWNIPMHKFLKSYVFIPLRAFTFRLKSKFTSNMLLPVLVTYFVSAFLHGLNFQLWAVLLSLAVLTFAEYGIRHKLAFCFNCPEIQATKRPSISNSSSWPLRCGTVAANVAFSLLAYFHLIYLGSGFSTTQQKSSDQNVGYSMQSVLSTWASLSYASHWACLASCVFLWLMN